MILKTIFSILLICLFFNISSMEKKDLLDGLNLKYMKKDYYTKIEAINGKKEVVAWAKVFKEGKVKTFGKHYVAVELLNRIFGNEKTDK